MFRINFVIHVFTPLRTSVALDPRVSWLIPHVLLEHFGYELMSECFPSVGSCVITSMMSELLDLHAKMKSFVLSCLIC
jgi:hypothetical protein